MTLGQRVAETKAVIVEVDRNIIPNQHSYRLNVKRHA